MNPQNNNSISTLALFLAITIAILGLITVAIFQAKSSVPATATLITASASDLTPRTSSLPSFSGFENLIDKGLADDQLTGLQYAFGQFSKTLPEKLTKVGIAQGTIVVVPHDRNSQSIINTIKFTVNTDKTSYDTEVDYSSLSAVELKVFDHLSGATLYDSGVIDINTQAPAD